MSKSVSNGILDVSGLVLYGLQSKWAELLFVDETIGAGEGNLVLKYSIDNVELIQNIYRLD